MAGASPCCARGPGGAVRPVTARSGGAGVGGGGPERPHPVPGSRPSCAAGGCGAGRGLPGTRCALEVGGRGRPPCERRWGPARGLGGVRLPDRAAAACEVGPGSVARRRRTGPRSFPAEVPFAFLQQVASTPAPRASRSARGRGAGGQGASRGRVLPERAGSGRASETRRRAEPRRRPPRDGGTSPQPASARRGLLARHLGASGAPCLSRPAWAGGHGFARTCVRSDRGRRVLSARAGPGASRRPPAPRLMLWAPTALAGGAGCAEPNAPGQVWGVLGVRAPPNPDSRPRVRSATLSSEVTAGAAGRPSPSTSAPTEVGAQKALACAGHVASSAAVCRVGGFRPASRLP